MHISLLSVCCEFDQHRCQDYCWNAKYEAIILMTSYAFIFFRLSVQSKQVLSFCLMCMRLPVCLSIYVTWWTYVSRWTLSNYILVTFDLDLWPWELFIIFTLNPTLPAWETSTHHTSNTVTANTISLRESMALCSFVMPQDTAYLPPAKWCCI